MLVRREGETLDALLKRLGKAIGRFYADGEDHRRDQRLARWADWTLTIEAAFGFLLPALDHASNR